MLGRSLASVFLGLAFAAALTAQSTDVRVSYLAETVSRGLPLLAPSELKSLVPLWPEFATNLQREGSLSPSADGQLVESWSLLAQDRVLEASGVLEGLWANPAPAGVFPVRLRAEAWFSTLLRLGQTEKASQAWKVWEAKYLSPVGLVAGLTALESYEPAVVPGVLRQAWALYPQDRRWLPWLVRYAPDFPQTVPLLTRERLSGGLSDAELLAILRRNPARIDVLLQAGYDVAALGRATTNDYATLIAQLKTGAAITAQGAYTWDTNGDGLTDARLVFDAGHLQTWSQGTLDPEGQAWSVTFDKGKPRLWQQSLRDARWTLDYEAYPYARTLAYEYGTHRIEYQFPPFVVDVKWAADERGQGDEMLWPWQMDAADRPLSLPSLVAQASLVVHSENGVVRSRSWMAQGTTWLAVEDSDGDGRPDTWSFYRLGKLDRVYRDPSGTAAAAGLQELYRQGEYETFLADPALRGRTELAYFPRQGIQLWDPNGLGSPLIRRMVWDKDSAVALAFGGDELPWKTMPPWDPRP